MKKSLINNYLKALSTIVNDNRVSFAITGNFADKCHIVAYWCNSQVLYDFVLFNDSSIINYDNLIDDYLAIMGKHPIMQGDKQLFSLNYDSVGYCYLAVSYNSVGYCYLAVSYDSSNMELFGVSNKRISRKLAEHLFNDVAFDDNYYINDYYNKYISDSNFNKTVLFSL